MNTRKRKLIYWGTFGGTLALFVGIIVAIIALTHGKGGAFQAFQLIRVGIVAGAALATLMCRLFRVSLELKNSQVLRDGTTTLPPAAQSGRVEAGQGVLDELGISVTAKTWHRMAWRDVERCEVETQLDALGRTKKMVCVVYGRLGGKPLRVDLTAAPEEKRQAFLDAIRGEPARTELEAAAPPAGRGTELSSALEPAGRGTELTSAAEPVTQDPLPAGLGERATEARQAQREEGLRA